MEQQQLVLFACIIVAEVTIDTLILHKQVCVSE